MKWLRIKRINLKLTLIFTSVIILLGLCITILNTKLYSTEVKNQMSDVVMQKMGLITGRLDNNIKSISVIHPTLINDRIINDAYERAVNESDDENIDKLTTYVDRHHVNSNSNINSIIPLGTNGEIYHTTRNFPSYKRLTKNNEDYEIIRGKQIYFKIGTPNTFPLDYTDPTEIQKNNITFYAQYYDMDNYDVLGYLAINIKKSFLTNSVKDIMGDTFSSCYIIDEYDNIIYGTGDINFEDVGENKHLGDEVTVGDKKYVLFESVLDEYNRWRVVGIVDASLFDIRTRKLNVIIYMLLGAFVTAMVFVIWGISENITKPIKDMVISMEEFRMKRWPKPLVVDNVDEIGELVRGYNDMLNSFIALTDDFIQRRESNKEIEIDLMEAKLGLLEAQINPHFIHNTLNTMNYLAIKEKNTELSKTIESFNALLRMSMSINSDFVTVMQEIENIKNYVHIQKTRFEDVFDITYTIDENAHFAMMPKLILQPIIENSILHGVLASYEKGHIEVVIKKVYDKLYINISDDGVGFDDSAVRNFIDNKKSGKLSKHIGIENVISRLRLHYGDKADINIESAIGRGCKFTMLIPYED